MSDKTLRKARGLNSIANPQEFKGKAGRGRRRGSGAAPGRLDPPPPDRSPPAPAPVEAPVAERAMVGPSRDVSPGPPPEPAPPSPPVHDRRPQVESPRSEEQTSPAWSGSGEPAPYVTPVPAPTPAPAPAPQSRADTYHAPAPVGQSPEPEPASTPRPSVSHGALVDLRAEQPARTDHANGGGITAPAPPATRQPGPVPHRAVTPGLRRKRRELSVPHPVAEAVERTGINPADLVMAGYRRHSEAIYAGVGGRMVARGRTRLRLSISDEEFELITDLGQSRGWNRSETVSVILAMELLGTPAPPPVS